MTSAKLGKNFGLDTAALVTAKVLQEYLLNIGTGGAMKSVHIMNFISTLKFISFRNVLNLSTLIVQL